MRTGSTWSFNVCRLFGQALAAERGEPFASAYLLDHELENFIQNHATSPRGPTVIKTHQVRRLAFDCIHSGHAKAICTLRGPRDCVVSLRTFMGGNLDEIVNGVRGGFDLLKLYQMSANTLFVRYEQIMTEPLEQIRLIAAHMNMSPSEAFLQYVERETSLQNCQKICRDLKQRSENQFRVSRDHRVDPVTGLHDNHIHSAESGRWRRELTSDEARSLTHIFQPWLLSFGYETPESIAALEDVWRSLAAGLPEQTFNPQPHPSQRPQLAAPGPVM